MSAHNDFSNDSTRSDCTKNTFYRSPFHRHLLVHLRPNQFFPESPGWQCDECEEETFDLDVLAFVSTEINTVSPRVDV